MISESDIAKIQKIREDFEKLILDKRPEVCKTGYQKRAYNITRDIAVLELLRFAETTINEFKISPDMGNENGL